MRNTEDKQLDELLSDAFRLQYENEINNGPTDQDLEAMHPFTQEHMKKAEELSRKHKKRKSLWRTQLGKAAAIILCVVTAAAVITMSNPVIRGNVSNAVTHLIDEYISIDFANAGDNEKIDISKTRITYIPEGYALTEDHSEKERISHIYSNDEGEYIIVDIENSRDIELASDNNTHEVEMRSINGYEGYVSYSEELKQGSVYFGSKYFTVAVSGMTEYDELIRIAENIVFKD